MNEVTQISTFCPPLPPLPHSYDLRLSSMKRLIPYPYLRDVICECSPSVCRKMNKGSYRQHSLNMCKLPAIEITKKIINLIVNT